MLEDIVRKNRSCRKFHQNGALTTGALTELVNLARLTASAANLQPLKYVISTGAEKNEAIFSCLSWAGYLKDWPGPDRSQRPTAYIVILGDTTITRNFRCDHGISAQTILLGAVERGYGGCIVGSINRPRLKSALKIPRHLQVLLVIALGKPNEKVMIEEARGDIRYWRDEKGIHHVPKRPLKEILLDL